jgi:hypothetical protein
MKCVLLSRSSVGRASVCGIEGHRFDPCRFNRTHFIFWLIVKRKSLRSTKPASQVRILLGQQYIECSSVKALNCFMIYDWNTIQKHYDTGCSIRDLTIKFGSAGKTIQRARDRGDFVPRTKNELRQRQKTEPQFCFCGEEKQNRRSLYCSTACHKTAEYNKYIEEWLSGQQTGVHENLGKVSSHVRKHLISLKGEQCWECGWAEVNPHTGIIPVQVDHIDGDPANNTEKIYEYYVQVAIL